MTKKRSIIYFLVYLSFLLTLRYLIIPKAFPNISSDSEIWFSSGILLILLGICITEKYFTKSLDALINSLTVFVVLMTINNSTFIFYDFVVVFSLSIGTMALVSFLLIDESKSYDLPSQKVARFLNKISTFLGKAKILFSIVFICSFVSYFAQYLLVENSTFEQRLDSFLLIIFWGSVILLEPFDKGIINPLLEIFRKNQGIELVGKVTKRNSPHYIYSEPLSGLLNFKYGQLFIIDKYNFDKQKKIFTIGMLTDVLNSEDNIYLELYLLEDNIEDFKNQIYIFDINDDIKNKIQYQLEDNDIYNKKDEILGKVFRGSSIDVINIKMVPGVDSRKELEEGDLISTDVYKSSVKYQIINVETYEESIDVNNINCFKTITAQQIGSWDEEKKKFFNTNWVPDSNSIILSEENKDTTEYTLDKNCFKVGIVPKSNYPIYINLDEAVSHHIAILGRTGSGKSYMASKLIASIAENDYKVIVLEIDNTNAQSLSKYIEKNNPDIISKETPMWSKNSNVWQCDLNLNSNDQKNVFLIDFDKNISNKTAGPLLSSEGAEAVINAVLIYHMAHPNQKICIVMEEAYDFIPENNFGSQQYGQPTVSRISQLVLKCRKHNIGFLIITQRTALVTKTILYSCNTIIALQSFDETSKNFMGAYVDSNYLETMSILPRFRAIVVGKGSSCDKPVIVDFEDK